MVKGRKKATKKTGSGKPPKKGASKKSVRPAKVFVYALALAALGGGGFLVYDRMRRRKTISEAASRNSDTIIINNSLPASFTSASTRLLTSGSSGTDSFPLKRGSRGPRVKMLQQALSKTTPSILIDGIFGSQTALALKSAGYPEVVDQALFNKITGSGATNVQVVFNPAELARELYASAQAKDLAGVLSVLSQMKSVSDYSSVNEYYKRQSFISKTIVTDLLEYAFKANESAKEEIRNEFLRMGLKVNATGVWSLPTGQAGLQGLKLFKDIITIRETVVTDAQNNRIPVRRHTILGDEIKIANGMTWFKSIDHSVLKVPTQDVKYT